MYNVVISIWPTDVTVAYEGYTGKKLPETGAIKWLQDMEDDLVNVMLRAAQDLIQDQVVEVADKELEDGNEPE
jgi:hypothetical protein